LDQGIVVVVGWHMLIDHAVVDTLAVTTAQRGTVLPRTVDTGQVESDDAGADGE
jgi:hypothetical protein